MDKRTLSLTKRQWDVLERAMVLGQKYGVFTYFEDRRICGEILKKIERYSGEPDQGG